MKNLLFSTAAALALCSCSNVNQYTIDGNFEGLTGTVYLFDEAEALLDSATVENGAFHFKGISESPKQGYISNTRGDAHPSFTASLIVEPGAITIATDSDSKMGNSATGTPSNDASKAFSALSTALVNEYRAEATTDERRTAIENEFNTITRATVENNLDNLFGAQVLAQQLAYELSGQEALDMIAKFSATIQQSATLTKLRADSEQTMKTDIGQPYIDIEQKSPAGEVVSLHSVISNPANKYTLIDFWASWCSPCMEEMPHLKKCYKEFGGKGFEIYAVSFDRDRAKWLEAIAANKMGWVHVSDVNSFDNQAARDYAVRGIPTNLLVDAQGKIVAKNLRGEDLHKKVSELLAAAPAAQK